MDPDIEVSGQGLYYKYVQVERRKCRQKSIKIGRI